MDFDNLLAVECNIKYDQNKLQNILKAFDQRINLMQLHINAVDRRCEHLELSDSTSDRKFGKFESFTIDNLRTTVDQFSSLNSSVSNYLGKKSPQYSKQEGTLIPLDPKHQFEEKLIQYSKQAEKIANQKIVKTQLSFIGSFLNKEPPKIQSQIHSKQNQFAMTAEQVKKLINQKFQQCKHQFTKQKKAQFEHALPNITHKKITGHRTSVVDKILQNQNEKDSLKIENYNDLRPSMLDLLEGQDLPDMSNKNFGKLQSNMEFQDIKNDEDIMGKKAKYYNQDSSQQSEKLREEISKIKETLQKDMFQKSLKKDQDLSSHQELAPIRQAESLSAQAVEALTLKLKGQMRQLIKQELSEISQKFYEISSKQELSDSNMTFMMKEFKHSKDDLEKLFNKSAQIDEKIENFMSENDEKCMNLAGRIREHELKINQMEISALNGQKSFGDSDYGSENCGDNRKFKQIVNVKKHSQFDPMSVSLNSNNVRISHVKNPSVPYHSLDSQIMIKLNSLAEKIHKIEEKVKNSPSNQSQKNLPKIDSVSSSSRNLNGSLLEQLRKDLVKTNEELSNTNEKVLVVKKSLQELEVEQNKVPKQFQKMEMDLHNINEIQQNRLIDLIKDIINRVLTDPFNNNFTNVLKRQINSKFLEIKHEYVSIMKDIESRVMDRADVGQLQKLKDFVQTTALQLKTLMQKKADNEDFKKGVKYLDTKVKEVYQYVKGMQEQETATNTRPQTQSSTYTRTGFLRTRKP